jgi:hypothetical protein
VIWAGREIQIVAGAGFKPAVGTCCHGFMLGGPSSGVCAVACEIEIRVAPDGMLGPEGGTLRVASRVKLQAEYFVGGLGSVFQCGVVSSGLEAHCGASCGS